MSHDEGMRIRREVLGDAHVDRAQARTTDFTAPFLLMHTLIVVAMSSATG